MFKFNNLCDDPKSRSADAYYVADVFDFYFARNGDPAYVCQFFQTQKITRVYLSGDHGPHFSSCQTMYNESCMHRLYGIDLRVFFLCSYHAYNRCDGAGVESKRITQHASKGRVSIRTAQEVSAELNRSEHYNSVAFTFSTINRSADRFPRLVSGEQLNLRKMCEVKYTYLDEHGKQSRTDGVLLCRQIPAIPGDERGNPYEVYDLRADQTEGSFCRSCSKEKQHPVWHIEDSPCPHTSLYTGKRLKTSLTHVSGPDPNRIQGLQTDKEYKANHTKQMGSHPCKVVDDQGLRCMHGHYYNTAQSANTHMLDKHKIAQGDPLLYQVTSKKKFACKESGCRKSYMLPERANTHMRKEHGYAESDLYLLPEKPQNVVPRRKPHGAPDSAPAITSSLPDSPQVESGESKNSDTNLTSLVDAVPAADSLPVLDSLPTIASSLPDSHQGENKKNDTSVTSVVDAVSAPDSLPQTISSLPDSHQDESGENKKSNTNLTIPLAVAGAPSSASSVSVSPQVESDKNLSEYELARQIRIRDNTAKLAELGLTQLSKNVIPAGKKRRRGWGSGSDFQSESDDAKKSVPTTRKSYSLRPRAAVPAHVNNEVSETDHAEKSDRDKSDIDNNAGCDAEISETLGKVGNGVSEPVTDLIPGIKVNDLVGFGKFEDVPRGLWAHCRVVDTKPENTLQGCPGWEMLGMVV